MRIHLTTLPHTHTTSMYDWCAYTAKARRFANMMTSMGHDVILYGGEANEAKVHEHVVVVSAEDQQTWFGDDPMWEDGARDWWSPHQPWWRKVTARTISEMVGRVEPGDVLAISHGVNQKPIAEFFPDAMTVEWGIGYEGVFSRRRCFESNAWMHHVLGLCGERNGNPDDTVIPNSFDVEDFDRAPGGGYALFLGRVVKRKGVEMAAWACEQADKPLHIAGPGVKKHTADRIEAHEVTLKNSHYEGVVLGEKKRRLLANADVLLCPTMYVEPFGGVAVEAMMSGVPVIASAWGAFTETITPGVDGYLCRTPNEFRNALDLVDGLDRDEIADRARSRFSTSLAAFKYDTWLNRLREA